MEVLISMTRGPSHRLTRHEIRERNAPTQVTRGPSLLRSWSVWHSCTGKECTASRPRHHQRDGAAELQCAQRPYLNPATRCASRAMRPALSCLKVPAGSPLTNTVGLDHTGMREQPAHVSLLPIMSHHVAPFA
jgi:hypothetical protein